jgi:hypothetical protein
LIFNDYYEDFILQIEARSLYVQIALQQA